LKVTKKFKKKNEMDKERKRKSPRKTTATVRTSGLKTHPNRLLSRVGLEHSIYLPFPDWLPVKALICLGNSQSSPRNHQVEETKSIKREAKRSREYSSRSWSTLLS